MKYNENPDLMVHATDYSAQAVDVVKVSSAFGVVILGLRAHADQAQEMYPCPAHGEGKIKASVWDITAKPSSTSTSTTLPESLSQLSIDSLAGRPDPCCYSLPEGVEPGTVDVITVIYVLSALNPKEWEQAIHNLYTVGIRLHLMSFR